MKCERYHHAPCRSDITHVHGLCARGFRSIPYPHSDTTKHSACKSVSIVTEAHVSSSDHAAERIELCGECAVGVRDGLVEDSKKFTCSRGGWGRGKDDAEETVRDDRKSGEGKLLRGMVHIMRRNTDAGGARAAYRE